MRRVIVSALVLVTVMVAVPVAWSYHDGMLWIAKTTEKRGAMRLIGGRIVRDGSGYKHVGGTREYVLGDVVVCRYWDPLDPLRIQDCPFWPEGSVRLRTWLQDDTTLPVFPGHCPVWWRPAAG